MRFNHSNVIGEIDNLPGCSQVAVFHSVFVPEDERGKGKGKKAHDLRLVEARHLGYDSCICTVDMNNKAQLAILNEFDWVMCGKFKSTKTGHQVAIFMRNL